MGEQRETRECPHCKEEIKAEAIKCKHCGSRVAPERPAHEGICPYCKEEIHPDAIKCKHCKSMLGDSAKSDDGCGCSDARPTGRANMMRQGGSRQGKNIRRGFWDELFGVGIDARLVECSCQPVWCTICTEWFGCWEYICGYDCDCKKGELLR
jgi:hypothetical protein